MEVYLLAEGAPHMAKEPGPCNGVGLLVSRYAATKLQHRGWWLLLVPAAANRLQSALGGFLSGGLTLALDA